MSTEVNKSLIISSSLTGHVHMVKTDFSITETHSTTQPASTFSRLNTHNLAFMVLIWFL